MTDNHDSARLHGHGAALGAALVLLLGLGALPAPVGAEEITVPIANPGQPVHLKADIMQGSITVEAYPGNQVLLDWSSDDDTSKDASGKPEKVDGMYRIPNRSFGLSAEADGNDVEVQSGWGHDLVVKVKVPARTSVTLHSVNCEYLKIIGLSGEHELNCVNGEIYAEDISGSLVANSTNGDVKVTFKQVDPQKAMSFITFNGDIDVTFPAAAKGDLKMSSMQGDIYSDFQLEVQPTAPKVDHDNHHFSVKVEREVQAKLGGGGPELRFKTFNGDIRIRRQGS